VKIARAAYWILRRQYPDRPTTIAALADRLLRERETFPPEAPPGDVRMLAGWAKEYQWEQDWLRERAKEELQDEPQSITARIREVREVLDDVHLALRKHAGNLAATQEEFVPDDAVVLTGLWKTYSAALADLTALEASARKLLLEDANSPEFLKMVDEIAVALKNQYDGLGPQYEILCHTLALLSARVQAMLHSGRDVPFEEFAKVTALQIQTTAQIQKHTETTKSEAVTQEIRAMAQRMMEIVYNEIGKEQPVLAKRVLDTMAAKLGTQGVLEGELSA
jgi:hypothetical protein